MHGMSELVRYREYVVSRLPVIQEHVRIAVVHSPGIRAGSLVDGFLDVYPAFRARSFEKFAVFRAERRERIFYERVSVVVFHFQSVILGYRHIQIVHVKLLKT